MNNIHIKNEEQYKEYLEEIRALMKLEPVLHTKDGDRLSFLALIVEEYEKSKFLFKKPSAIDAIKFRMDEQKLKQNDLIPYIGSKGKVSEILSGKRSLTLPMIRALSKFLDIPTDILIQEEQIKNHDANPFEIIWEKFPIAEMKKRKWIENIELSEIKNNHLIAIQSTLPREIRWRKTFSNVDEEKSVYPLIAWSYRVMTLANEEKVDTYDSKLITKEYLKEVAKLSKFEQGPLLAKEFLGKFGIKLIFLKSLSKSKFDGGCFLDKEGKPIIGMTIRYDRIDNFWHTLLHELAHVCKHLKINNDIYIDDVESDPQNDPIEKEADLLAKESFIPREIWKRSDAFSLQTDCAVIDLAKTLNIHPAIVAGRLRFETKDYSKFYNLIGQGEVSKIIQGSLHV